MIVSRTPRVAEREIPLPWVPSFLQYKQHGIDISFDSKADWDTVDSHFKKQLLSLGFEEHSPMSVHTTAPNGEEVRLFNHRGYFRNDGYSVYIRDVTEHARATNKKAGKGTGIGMFSIAVSTGRE